MKTKHLTADALINPFSQESASRTIAEMLDAAEAARELFSEIGTNLKGSRLLRYLKALAAFRNLDSATIQNRGATGLVGQTLLEIADFIDIATLDRDFLRDAVIFEKLQNSLRGRAFRRDYGALEHDPHRDDAFELCTAAYLARFHVLGPPPTDRSDVVFQDGYIKLPVECKRLASSNGLKSALRSAKRQLRDRCKSGASAGLVAVDVSRAINPRSRIDHFSTSETMMLNCAKKLHSFISGHLATIQHSDVVANEILGIVFRFIYPGYCGAANARRYIEWSFVDLHSDEVRKAEFRLCVDKFGDGPTTEQEYGNPPLKIAIPLSSIRIISPRIEILREANMHSR